MCDYYPNTNTLGSILLLSFTTLEMNTLYIQCALETERVYQNLTDRIRERTFVITTNKITEEK